ncbi:MAG: hypothetical protein NTZ60_07090 [Campylobacterales bacterium]|nr:hypothetical protein [Campylobacterales bacterium]
MQVKFEFVIYNEALDKFEQDGNVHLFELDDEQTQTYNLLKNTDLYLYNWFKESAFFLNWIKEEVYPQSIGKKIAISEINDISFIRFYFFKVTSGDIHYEYFKKLFNIFHELNWQEREEFGEEILKHLMVKRQELIIELKKDVI